MKQFKKNINFIYLLFLPLAIFSYKMNKELSGTSVFFYGFAENKETEINLDQAVAIHKIHVTPGQKVRKGQVLMEVKQARLDFKIDKIEADMEQSEALLSQEKQKLIDKIAQLKIQKQKKTTFAETEINRLKMVVNLSQSLLQDLESIDISKQTDNLSADEVQINFLQKQLNKELELIDLNISQLKNQLDAIHIPADIIRKKLSKEINFHEQEQQKLSIHAPSDGLIGNIHCKSGEHIDAFSTLLNFYESNPTLVKGFVHESLILEVKVKDSLKVASSLHPTHQIDGIVMGLGSRIVEIPERLRKIPEYKTYGREVLIRIPAKNPFLQKEKVMLNPLNITHKYSVLSLFSPHRPPIKRQEKAIRKTVSLTQ